MNHFWSKCKTELLGKVDNDCLVTPDWIKILAHAHRDIENLGAIACWHYRKEDFDESIAFKKIHIYNGHKIFKHPWVCGSGFLIKRKTFLKVDPFDTGSSSIGLTRYFLKLASAGYINGWYYPLILQEHMDDPYSRHSLIKDDESVTKHKNTTYVLREHKIKTYKDRLKRSEEVLNTLLHGPCDVKYYIGWHRKIRRIFDFGTSILRRK